VVNACGDQETAQLPETCHLNPAKHKKPAFLEILGSGEKQAVK
jgi:hypothetical protein